MKMMSKNLLAHKLRLIMVGLSGKTTVRLLSLVSAVIGVKELTHDPVNANQEVST